MKKEEEMAVKKIIPTEQAKLLLKETGEIGNSYIVKGDIVIDGDEIKERLDGDEIKECRVLLNCTFLNDVEIKGLFDEGLVIFAQFKGDLIFYRDFNYGYIQSNQKDIIDIAVLAAKNAVISLKDFQRGK